ncbi:SemiSWEET transporter [Geodermatophilus sp. SYSU D00804]
MPAVLGIVASTLSIAVVWPQVRLSCRHGRTRGLSPTGSWLAVALNLAWLTFGLLAHDPAQVVTNAVVGAGNAAVLAALLLTQPALRTRRVLARTASGAAGLAALAGGCLVAVDLGAAPAAAAAVLASVAAVVGVAAAVPQPLGLLRDRTQDVSGLSPVRWWLGAGSCAAWTGHGLAAGQVAMALSAAVGLACALVTCAVLASRRTPAPVVPLPVRRPVRPAEARPVLAAAA